MLMGITKQGLTVVTTTITLHKEIIILIMGIVALVQGIIPQKPTTTEVVIPFIKEAEEGSTIIIVMAIRYMSQKDKLKLGKVLCKIRELFLL